MIVSTIKQFGLRLRADPEEIPFQYSANIQMKFEKDENYRDYTMIGYYIPPGESEAKLLNINDYGTFTLGPDCFKNRGTLSFSFNLVNSIEEVHLGSIDFDVRHAFGDSSAILPEPEEVWISVVTKVAEDAIKEDVELVKQKAKEASQSSSLANDKASEAEEYANNANQSAGSASLSASSALTAKNDAIAASNSAIQAKQDAEQSANNAKNSANTALENANKSTEAIETVTQIKTEIENKDNDFDTNYQEKLNAFNDNATEKQSTFNQNVTSANTNFDNKVTQANSDLDAKVQEAKKQAQKAKDEADRATQATEGKLDKNLGAENANKVLGIGADGNVTPIEMSAGVKDYNDLENKPQINGVELSGNKSGNDVGLVNNQQGIANVGKVLGIGQDGLVVPVENAGASDNIIYKDVAKQLNPNITDSFQRAMWNLKLYGQSTQENTTGSQLWVNPEPKTLNGVTLTIENGWVILNGTCTANGNISIIQRKLEAGEYTLSAEVEGSYPIKGTVVSQVYSANGGILTITTGSMSPITRELNSANNYEFRIFIRKDFVYNNYKVRTMLNKGSEALPWEPYTSGQPSPSPQYPQEITAISEFDGNIRNSFQLFDKTQFKPSDVNGITLTVDDNGIKLSGTATASAGFTHSFDNTYFKKIFKSGNIYVRKNTSLNVLFTLYIRNGIELLGYANDTTPFNITEEIFQNPNTRGEFYIFISSGVTVDGYINPMVYQNGDGTWQPFDSNPQEFTYTPTNPMYSTQDGSICDYVDVEKGVEVYNMSGAVVFDGNENWSMSGINYGDYVGFYLNGYIARSLVMCNKLPYYNFENNEASKEAIYIFGDGSLRILILKSRLTEISINGLKTWLSQNPITVVYPLVSPTETPIPQERLQMLRSLYTYTGVTNFLCNAPVSFTYERSLQIVINNLENAIGQTNANILLGGTL